MYIKVKDHPSLVRDQETKAILNVNNKDLNKYREERAKFLKLRKIEEQNLTLKQDIEHLKELVNKLMEQK